MIKNKRHFNLWIKYGSRIFTQGKLKYYLNKNKILGSPAG